MKNIYYSQLFRTGRKLLCYLAKGNIHKIRSINLTDTHFTVTHYKVRQKLTK